MRFKFIIDTQLPPSLKYVFEELGFNTIHTTFFPNGHLLNDIQIRKIALKENRIIVSKDTDFLDAFFLHNSPPKVLMIETGNISNKELFSLVGKDLPTIIDLFKHHRAQLVILDRNKIISY